MSFLSGIFTQAFLAQATGWITGWINDLIAAIFSLFGGVQ